MSFKALIIKEHKACPKSQLITGGICEFREGMFLRCSMSTCLVLVNLEKKIPLRCLMTACLGWKLLQIQLFQFLECSGKKTMHHGILWTIGDKLVSAFFQFQICKIRECGFYDFNRCNIFRFTNSSSLIGWEQTDT